MSMAFQESAVSAGSDKEAVPRTGNVLCCDCGRRIRSADAVSADPQDPLTVEDKARIALVGPVRGLFVCADRAACKAALERKRFSNFVLACRATKALARA